MCSAMREFCIDFERLLWWCKQCGKRLQLTSYIDTKLTFNQWELFCHQRGSGGLENRGGQVRSFSFLTNHSNLQFCQTDNFGSNCGLLRIEKVQMFKFWPGGLLRMLPASSLTGVSTGTRPGAKWWWEEDLPNPYKDTVSLSVTEEKKKDWFGGILVVS